jgi:hypothetical protein
MHVLKLHSCMPKIALHMTGYAHCDASKLCIVHPIHYALLKQCVKIQLLITTLIHQQVALGLDRTIAEVSKKLEDIRNRLL